MSNTKLKYPQKVHAKINRIYDEKNKEYYLMRNDTKIIFGNGGGLLGSVIMTNQGSFVLSIVQIGRIF
jgi:hypothetical protein